MADKKNTIADSDQQTQEAGANPNNVGYLELAIGRSIRLPNGSFLKINLVSVAGSPVLPLVSASLRPGDEITIEAKDGGLAVFNEVMLLVKGSPVKIEPGSFKRYGGVSIGFKIPTDSSNQFGEGDEVKIVLVGPSFEAEIQHKFIFFEKSEKDEENKNAEKQAKDAQKRAEDFQDLEGQPSNVGNILMQATTDAVKGVIGGVTGGIFDPALAKQMNDALAGKDVSKLKSLAQAAVKKGDLKALEEAFKNATDPAHKEILRQSIESVKKQQALAKEKEQQAKKSEGEGLGNIRSKQQAAGQAQSELDDDDIAAQAEILPENEQEVDGSTLAQQTIRAKNITGLGTKVSAGGTQTIGGRAVGLSGSAEVSGRAAVSQTSTADVAGRSRTVSGRSTVTGSGSQTISGGTAQVSESKTISSTATTSGQGGVSAKATVSGSQQASVNAGGTTKAGAKVTSQGSGGGQAQVDVSGRFKQQAVGGTSETSQQVSAGQTASGQTSDQILGGQTRKTEAEVVNKGQTGTGASTQAGSTAKLTQQFSGNTAGYGSLVGAKSTGAFSGAGLSPKTAQNIAGQIPKGILEKLKQEQEAKTGLETKGQEQAQPGEIENEKKPLKAEIKLETKEEEPLESKPEESKGQVSEKAEAGAVETTEEKKAGMQIMARLQAAEQGAPKNAVELNRNLERVKLREAGEEQKSDQAEKAPPKAPKTKSALRRGAEKLGRTAALASTLMGGGQTPSEPMSASGASQTESIKGPRENLPEQTAKGGETPAGSAFGNEQKAGAQNLAPKQDEAEASPEDLAEQYQDSFRQLPQYDEQAQKKKTDKKLEEEIVKPINEILKETLNTAVMWVWGTAIPTFGFSILLGAIVGDLLWALKKPLIRRSLRFLPNWSVGKELDSGISEEQKKMGLRNIRDFSVKAMIDANIISIEEIADKVTFGMRVKGHIIAMNFLVIVLTVGVFMAIIYIGCNTPLKIPGTYRGTYIGTAYPEVCEKFVNFSKSGSDNQNAAPTPTPAATQTGVNAR